MSHAAWWKCPQDSKAAIVAVVAANMHVIQVQVTLKYSESHRNLWWQLLTGVTTLQLTYRNDLSLFNAFDDVDSEPESECRRNTPLFIPFQGRPVGVLGVRWKSDGSPVEVRRKSNGSPVEVRWESGGSPMEIWWKSDGSPMEVRWKSNGNPVEVRWKSDGSPMGENSDLIERPLSIY